jgi:hypothetical protein
MSYPLRQRIERAIVGRAVRDILKAGHTLSVNDGEEFVLRHATRHADVMRALFSVDEERLYVHRSRADTRRIGWVFLVYGNDPGTEVICDHTCNLESLLAGATACADTLTHRHRDFLVG